MDETPRTPPAAASVPVSAPASADVERIVLGMVRWRLLSKRRVIGRLVLREAAPGLDVTHLDVIEAVRLIGERDEVTVGAVAQAMDIDPSRGSRLVSQLVEEGLLRRAVSQADARRTVVELADRAEGFRQVKDRVHRDVIGRVTADWRPEEVTEFSELLLRFIDGLEAVTRTEEV